MLFIKKLNIRHGYRYALFLCLFCNIEVEKRYDLGMKSKSCGCSQYKNINHNNTKHGECYSRLYRIWGRMVQRCTNDKYTEFRYYGGRGITIYNEWLKFIPFRDWALNNGYTENLQVDRKDTNSNYEPSNCHFVTPAENAQNRRSNKLTKGKVIEIRDKFIPYKYTIRMLAKEYGVRENYIYRILKKEAWRNI